ncbi:MAG: hypothetical protein IPM82_12035 [Saprospiraceae bacterium]|nr:hypothetical protein [Saprospiraceae bacterium]
MIFTCCNENRKNIVREHPTLNGIDFLEIIDASQTTLEVHFLNELKVNLAKENVFIEGGIRNKNIKIDDVTVGAMQSPPANDLLIVKVVAPGDFSDYTLRLVTDEKNLNPPAGFDAVLSSIVFSFKVACNNEFDCQPDCDCPPETHPVPPDINYLAKDYASFRRLMLDRMALLAPGWKERNPADLGIVLVELLAYTADYLSYRQDAIATEAYLGTARKRTSIRRHTRLVDYRMHDGCNARAWLHIQVGKNVNGVKLERGSGNSTTKVFTKVESLTASIFNAYSEYHKKALAARPKVFELMHDIELYAPHNVMSFYTWGEESCCLPKGAAKATLLGHFPT